jgi:hypothetical protein
MRHSRWHGSALSPGGQVSTIVRERLNVWDQPCDVRWTIKSRNPGRPLPLQLSGPSVGLAFTMGLGQVLLPEA